MNRLTRVITGSAATLVLSALVSGGPALAQQQVPDARVKELMAQALDQVQNGTAAQSQQDTRPVVDLTLDEAVRMANEKNIDLSVQRLNPQLQELSLQQARTAYTPTYSVDFSGQDSSSQSGNTLSGGAVVHSKNYTFNNSLSKALPWMGTSLSMSWNNSRDSSNSNNASYNPGYRSSFQARLTQPLWRNFKIDSARQSIQTATISRQLADVTLRGTTASTLASTKNTYWDYVYAVQAVDVARQSLAIAEKLVQDNQTRVEIGTMAPIDVVQAQSQAASQRRALVQAEAVVRTSELALKRLIVSSTQDPLWNARINPVDRPTAANPEAIDIESAIRTALASRTDLISARENLRSSEISLRYMGNQIKPDLNLNFSFSSSGRGGVVYVRPPGVLVGPATERVPGGVGDALSILARIRYPVWNVGLSFSYPLGRSSQQASLARARIQFEQQQAQLKSSELRVATDVTSAGLTVQSNLQQVQAAAAARELAQRQLEAAQSKFDVGMATNYEVIQAQRDLDSARNSELQAILNYRKSLVSFELVQQTGSSGGGTSVSTGGQ